MARNRHGGRRTPRNPAPVSGPGALSQRTDGGPGQPIRTGPSQVYGERARLEAQQRGAPLAQTDDSQGEAGGPVDPPSRVSATGSPRDVFGPTRRPNEPITAGIPMGPGSNGPQLIPDDPDQLIRLLYSIHPDPALLRLLKG